MLSQAVLKGAIGGRAENQYLLGQKYYYGKGTDKNLTLAESWFKESAKRGHLGATFMYAYLLLTGESGIVDIKKGIKFLKRASAKNYSHALLMLARNYYYGFGVERSEKKAFRLWEKGYKLGIAEAEYYMGICYVKGIYVKENTLKGKRHIFNAVENGFNPNDYENP